MFLYYSYWKTGDVGHETEVRLLFCSFYCYYFITFYFFCGWKRNTAKLSLLKQSSRKQRDSPVETTSRAAAAAAHSKGTVDDFCPLGNICLSKCFLSWLKLSIEWIVLDSCVTFFESKLVWTLWIVCHKW